MPIPKIMHQMYKNDTLPEKMKECQDSFLNLHKDWEYKFWTDESIDNFIKTEYDWFYPVFTSFKYPIQRIDSSRYFSVVLLIASVEWYSLLVIMKP